MPIVHFELKTYQDNLKVNKQPLDAARAYIAVIGRSIKEVDGEEFITVSHKCRTSKEVDENVDQLIEELKKMKSRGKAFFDKENRRRK